MNNHFEIALLLIVAFLVMVVFLWLSNLKDRTSRYHQFLSMVFASVYALLLYIFYVNNIFSDLFVWIDLLLKDMLDGSIQVVWLASLIPFTFFLIGLLLYIPIKRLLIWLLKTKKVFDPPPAITSGVYEDKNGKILLKNNYYYPLKYMFASAIIFSILYCLSFFAYKADASFPAYGLLLIFIFLETYWFLNGKSELSEIQVESVSQTEIDFYALWEDYKKTWSENLGLAFIKRGQFTEWSPSNVGGEMLIKNYKQNPIFEKIQKHMIDLLNKGKKIIIFIPDNFQPLAKLEESEKYKIVREILFGFDFTSQFVTTKIMNLKLESSIYITSIDKFLFQSINIEGDYELYNWFKNLRLVLYFGYDVSLIESPESSVSVSSIIKYLSEDPADLTSIVFAEDRESQQASWKSNLKTNPHRDREIKINDSESENTYYLGWKAEKHFEAGLFNNYANRYIGPLASLVGLPYIYGISTVNIKPNQEPFVENYENSIGEKDDWKKRYRKLQVLVEGDLLKYTKVHHHNLSITHSKDKVLIVQDNYYNAPFLFKYYNEFGKTNHLINIVSPPHILRQYFNDNFEYFSKNPIKPLSYMLIAGDKFTLALALIEKLVKCKLTLKELAQDFSEIGNDEKIVIKQLRDLFNDVYSFDIIDTSYLLVTEAEDGELSFSLKTDIKDQIELFKKVEFFDKNNNLVFLKNKNLLFQKYLRGQVHTFRGRTYSIRNITNIGKNIVVRLESTEPKHHFSYKEKKKVHLTPVNNWKRIESKNPTNEYALNIYSKSFSVSTSGYYELNDGNSLAKGRYTVHRMEDVKDRDYINGRICKISFANYRVIPNFWQANITLRIVFEEVIKILFPDSFHYLMVRCFAERKDLPDNIISQYYTLDNILGSADEDQAGIYIFEDSVFDMGHLKSILENIDYILKVIDDYLSYIIEKIQGQSVPIKNFENHSKAAAEYFLSFKLKKIKALKDFPDPIDIQAAKNLTGKCLRLHNDITYDRWDNKIPTGPVKQAFWGSCKSCGKADCKNDNAELFDDGRIICNDCKKNNQRTKIEEENLITIAKEYFEKHQTLPPISRIKFTSLKDISDRAVAGTSRFPHAAIKVSRVSKNFEVFVENFRNELDTCTAIVHAFTHVWHIKNLNAKKVMETSNHLDGHAFMMMEGFLNNKNLHPEFSNTDTADLLREIKVYRMNYFQKAYQKLNATVEGKGVFFYLSMNYAPDGQDNFEIVEF